ncbi:RNA-binding protein 26 [Branchiostoma belcheri]|nr:RNA-binding protein 26 [Branchiostoma belcheri]
MPIENVEAFKTWLANTLSPICDADPQALAKYVVALVKKDKPQEELKALCKDQLEVFLQKETNTFVESLFVALNTKTYLPVHVPEPVPVPVPEPEEKKPEPIITHRKSEDVPDDDERDFRRVRKRSRSRSPHDKGRGRSGSAERDRKRYGDDDRPRRRDDYRPRGRERDYRRDYGRERRNYTSPDRRPHKDDSSSAPGESAAGNSPDGVNAPPPTYTTPSLSSTITVVSNDQPWMSQGGRGNFRGNDRGRGGFRGGRGRGGPPRPQRCRDYDEKGFCMRGELCPFDHGPDPVVVEDSSLPGMLAFPPASNGQQQGMPPIGPPRPPMSQAPPFSAGGPPPPPQQGPPNMGPRPRAPMGPRGPRPPRPPMSQPPPATGEGGPRPPPPGPGLAPPRPPPGPPPPRRATPPPGTAPPHPPVPRGGPPPPPRYPQDIRMTIMPPKHIRMTLPAPPPKREPFDQDGYNPELPGLDAGPSVGRPPYWSGGNNRNPTQTRALVSVPMVSTITTPKVETQASESTSGHTRVVIDSGENRKRTFHQAMGPGSGAGMPYTGPPVKQGGHVRDRLGWKHTNCTLEIKKVPRDMNTVSKLSGYFERFGTVSNVQVCFDGDAESALVTFSSNAEARAAHQCTDAVLNNRFIRVFWHNKDQSQHHQGQSTPGEAAHPNPGPVRLSVRDRLYINPEHAKTTGSSGPISEKVHASSSGLSKTVYNPEAMKKVNTPQAAKQPSASQIAAQKVAEAQEALRKKQEEKKKEALKLKMNLQTKKQELLQKQIQQQKMLIERLEKNKSMAAPERDAIMKTLKTVQESITKLKTDEPPKAATSTKPKTRQEAQRELLDAEMDLLNAKTAGEDTTALKKRLAELQQEAQSLAGAVLDRRPKQLAITGYQIGDKDEILTHLSQFGEVEKVEYDETGLTLLLEFKTRLEAEIAATKGSIFKGMTLNITWNLPTRTVTLDQDEEGEVDLNSPGPGDGDTGATTSKLCSSQPEVFSVISVLFDIMSP